MHRTTQRIDGDKNMQIYGPKLITTMFRRDVKLRMGGIQIRDACFGGFMTVICSAFSGL